MRRVVFAGIAGLCSCVASSELQVTNPQSPSHPPGDVPSTSTAALVPSGDAFLPPLSGHRLAARNGITAVSDPEGQQSDGRAPGVYLVDASGQQRRVTLPDGARPMAIELDASGATAFVVLEGSGGVATIDTAKAEVTRF